MVSGTGPAAGEGGRRPGAARFVRWARFAWLARLPLWLKLVAVMVCLAGAGLGVIGLATVSLFRGYLIGQAGRQAQAGAGRLAGHSFMVGPTGGPALTDPASGKELGVEVLDGGGERLVPAGPGVGRGPLIRARPAWIAAHLGRPVTVPAAGGRSWLVVLEPVRYRVRHLPFIYGGNNYSVLVAGRATGGLPGTLVVGTSLAGVGRQTGRLAVTELAAGAAAIVLLAGLGTALARASLRELASATELARAVAAGQWLGQLPGRGRVAGAGRLARSLNSLVDRAEEALCARTAAEAAGRASAGRLGQRITAAGHALRGPLSIIAGLAWQYRERGPGGDPGRMMRRVGQEADRMSGVIDALGDPGHAAGPPG